MSQSYEELTQQLEQLANNPPDDLLKSDAARHRLVTAAAAIIPRIEPAKDAIQRINYQALELAVARVGSQINLFKNLSEASGPLTTEQIAQGIQGDVATLNRFFRYMAALSMIEEVDIGKWSATPFTHVLAQPGAAGGLIHNFDTTGRSLFKLVEFLESKRYKSSTDPADTPFSMANDGQGAFQWLMSHSENMHALGQWMTVQRYASEFWLSTFPFKSVVLKDLSIGDLKRKVFVDVGGGVGHQSEAVLKEFPELKGHVVLQDQAIALEKSLDIEGLEKEPIDFFESQPTKGAKAYYLRNILHDWPDNKCFVILKHIKAAMAPDSLLLIDEMCIPARGAHKIATQVDLTMMINLAGEERSELRWHELLAEAGFKIDDIYTYQKELGDSVIVAKLAA